MASRLRILERLRRQEMSRTELAQKIGLGQATVSGIVKELVACGLLRESRVASDTRGRPRVALSQNPGALLVAGAFVYSGGAVDLRISDMAGTILARVMMISPAPAAMRDIVETIAMAFDTAMQQVSGDNPLTRRPTAIGVSLPAMIDAAKGQVHWLPPHPPCVEPVAQWLTNRIGIPAFIDNVGNIIALAERWFGNEAFDDNLCVVVVATSVALGQFVGGAIYRGAHSINAEIGHAKTGINAQAPCPCGAHGCLWLVAGLSGMASRAIALGLWDGDPNDRYAACMAQLSMLAKDGNDQARLLLAEAGTALGIALANHIGSWDPSRLLVLAEDEYWAQDVLPGVLATIQSNLPLPARGITVIDARRADPDLQILGTLALALDHIFRAPDLGIFLPR